MADLVTGEAVPLELRLAKLPSRGIAIFFDLFVQVCMLYGLIVLVGTPTLANDDALVAAVALVGSITILVGYPVLFETLTRGKSLGKLVLGLRVVQEDGGPVRFRQSLIRALAGVFVDFWATAGAGAILSSLLSAKGKRIGDTLGGTVVVIERVPFRRAVPPEVAPSLAAWARSLQMARLPDALAIEARQYVIRHDELAPDVAELLGRRIATEMSRHVNPPAPPGTSAHAYVATVLAERRERELRAYASRQGRATSTLAASSPPLAPMPVPGGGAPSPEGPPDAPGGFARPA